MPELVVPRLTVAPSLRDVARTYGDDRHPAYLAPVALADAELPGWVDGLLADTRPHAPRPAEFVPSTHLWWVQGTGYLGRVHIRHRLTPALRLLGGHLGYYVAPPHRGQGHATAMLRAALPVAAALGLECLLLTCDVANPASRRVIERGGGLAQDRRGDTLRFWVPTS